VRGQEKLLRYQCGLARRFEDPETEELYDERWMECQWNKTWTPVDSLDPCRWVQCIDPPQVVARRCTVLVVLDSLCP
jgi:hypothetical protein